MEFLHKLVYTIFHLRPDVLSDFMRYVGTGKLYAVLALIVFCETGLVVTPFLPGDSLLFTVGALAAVSGSPLSLPVVMALLCLAANCGDLLNYSLGSTVGPRLFRREKSLLLSRKHLDQAQAFYERHGRKTIILARFVPIVRTFAPFVAGVGRMNFFRFAAFSVTGGVLWVVSLSLAGYFFGQIPFVAKHFELVVVAIVAISLVPVAIQVLRPRRESRGFDPKPSPAPSLAGEEG